MRCKNTYSKQLQSANGYLKLVDINYKSETEATVNFESCRLKRAHSSGYYLDTNRRRVKCGQFFFHKRFRYVISSNWTHVTALLKNSSNAMRW